MEFMENYFDISKVLDAYEEWVSHILELRKINQEAFKIEQKKVMETYDNIVNFTRMWLSSADEYNKVSKLLSNLLKLI
jgi:non-homologous end joining protein Ku